MCQFNGKKTHRAGGGVGWTVARLMAAALLATQARAANTSFTWDSSGANPTSPVDGDGNWDTTTDANWSNGTNDVTWPAIGTSNTAVFGSGGTAGTVTITSPVAASDLTFNAVSSGDYTIAASGVGGLTLNGSATITVNSGNPTISAPISGLFGLTLTGGGMLTLAGSNSYSGQTVLQSGRLAIASDAAVNNGVGGIVFDGGSLELDNYASNLSLGNAGPFTFLFAAAGAASSLNGSINGSTYLTYFGPGDLVLNGNNTYSGATYAAGGTLTVGSNSALPQGGSVVFYAGGTVAIDSDAKLHNQTSNLNFIGAGGDLQFENYDSQLSFNSITNLGLGAAVGAASTLSGAITGNSDLNYVGPGTLNLTGNNSYTGATNVSAGALLIGAAGALPKGTALTVGGTYTAAALVLAGGTGAQTVSSLSITSGSTLDITNNSLAINYGSGNPSPLSSIEAQIASGYDDGAWDGTGIVSSLAAINTAYAIGYADGSTDSGTSVPAGEVLIKYTLIGDANLDGTVNLTDLLALLNSYGQSNRDWSQGDFNYDGTVNLTDLLGLLNNYGETASPTSRVLATGAGVVPEPTMMGLLAMGSAGVLMRRRKRKASNGLEHGYAISEHQQGTRISRDAGGDVFNR